VRVKDRVAAARQVSDVTERRSFPIEGKRLEACMLIATEALMEARLGLGKHVRLVAEMTGWPEGLERFRSQRPRLRARDAPQRFR